MPVEYFLRYKGQLYDIGTKIRFRSSGMEWEGTIVFFSTHTFIVKCSNGHTKELSQHSALDKLILEIIEPVYYTGPVPEPYNPNINPPGYEDSFVGTVWYIVIMVVGVIFKDRWLIWIFATIFYFLWQAGIMGGNKR
ncbi:MAG: hypothetical protein IJY28_10785 [Clostridia bacterium]|nr:hypothetical protein [Clostridia bacterium]